MLYKRLIINGEEYPIAVNQTGQGAPSEATVGAPGVLYMDTDTEKFYKCTAAIDGVYTWKELGASGGSCSGGNVDQSGGMSATASALLITILRNGVYSADQSANITALAAALGVTEEETPDVPVEPDEPENPDVVTYPVTNNLTNVVNSNGAESVNEGASYTATLSAVEGYNLDTVTVTMGGADITSTVYLDGVISIATVSGGIVITATAVFIPVYESVELTSSVRSYNLTAYSDGGDTVSMSNSATYGQHSTEVFSRDTEVLISFNLTGTIGTREAWAACVQPGFDDNYSAAHPVSGYYAAKLGTLGSTNNVSYTVKAGYHLAVFQKGANVQGTFSVVKGG